MDFDTLCIHAGKDTHNATGAVSVPIYQSATFSHLGVGRSTGYDYSRSQNPTRDCLEKTMMTLEGGCDALAFSTGMAAVAAVMELLSPGDHIVASDDLYGGSHRLFHHISKKNGIACTLVDTGDSKAVNEALKPNTKALFVETPTNPMMQVTDIAAVAEIAKKNSLLLIVDNTFLTPLFQRPLELGADIVVHSGTKYLGGHNDTLAGFLVVKDVALAERLRFIYKTVGACLAPFDSWLILRGIKTLAVRMRAQQESALRVARFLQEHPKVETVHYVGLPEHPSYELSCRQAEGFGAMISFTVQDEAAAIQVLERVRLIQFAESLGGVESLITYPMLQTHADIPPEEREAKGVNDRLLRLSVGLENTEDIIADLGAALA